MEKYGNFHAQCLTKKLMWIFFKGKKFEFI